MLGLILGAMAGFLLALAVSLTIKAFFPAENMTYGLAGVLIAFICAPTFGIVAGLLLSRKRKTPGAGGEA